MGLGRGTQGLEQAITEFMAAWNKNPKPFVWTATVESIVEKLSSGRQTSEPIRPGCTLPDGASRNVELTSYLSDAAVAISLIAGAPFVSCGPRFRSLLPTRSV